MYESVNKLNPPQFHTYYNYPNHNYNTDAMRNMKLALPKIRTSKNGLKSLKYSGCILCNNLSSAERSFKSKKEFSRIIKKHITDTFDIQ